ncbi:Predicted membrane fusion protein (MFP) component of efflux pump, membrane anchor protein YbhG [Georgfuchsia toluolica]|uniref:Predicted membrane fusion protein (MFP) component of efflux pump, membrane anchor protein YbhG n=1 Tax=Georgfuchsia toluolica TaxID=424218 RepID=A0A916J150_9PROT|nr:efflux RND transporter periplasmic adaptor subunit [Georgfuchsia toluolica]CAG4882663.1 Predicted membrane fusion protein (MFP) component of efflux pump, membrane anchor protein YbhG [Georgfuchsia toluolica]
MKRKIGILLLVIAIFGTAGGYFWQYTHNHEPPAHVLTLYGNVDIRQVQLAFNGSDRIDRMLVKEGETVRQGQLLASLDTTRLQQNVALLEAQQAAQHQVVARLKAGNRPEEIRKARADEDAARIEANNAERTYHRLNDLVARNFVAKQQADDAKAAADAAHAKYEAAQAMHRLAELGPRMEDIAAASATLKANGAALAIASRQLADASLYAPADGVIQDRILEPGDMASPQLSVYTLALTDPIWVRAYVQGSDMGKIHNGMRAEVTTDSYPGKRYRAWLGYISPSAEFTPKSVETTEVRSNLVYQLRVFVCNSQNELRLGMPATVNIVLDQSQSVATEIPPCPSQ